MNNRNYQNGFNKEWGDDVASGGYVQLPHDFLRNIGKLEISCNEALILAIVMGYKRDSYISAAQIADHLGISIGPVRNAFRSLGEKKLLHRRFYTGEANRFSYGGLRMAVNALAKSRQASMQKLDRGMDDFYAQDGQNLYTNKELIKTKNKDYQSGYVKFQNRGKDLKKKTGA
jgi:hypothetical protein